MLHPDYQYSPRLVTAMASLVASGHYDVVLGSRILGGQARRGGMPAYKYVANRFLTLAENLALGEKLSEYHTGFRAYSRAVLETLPLEENSDDFVFDNEMLVQAVAFGFRIGEVSCPTKYFPEASSINFRRSVRYGLGVLGTAGKYLLQRSGLAKFRSLSPPREDGSPSGEARQPDRQDRERQRRLRARELKHRLFANTRRKGYTVPLTRSSRPLADVSVQPCSDPGFDWRFNADQHDGLDLRDRKHLCQGERDLHDQRR